MANSFFVPFNFEPIETTIETTTYSLAAGKYAKVTPTSFGAALVADGETLLPALEISGTVSTSSTSFVTAFENTSGVPLVVNWLSLATSGVPGESKVVFRNGYNNWYSRLKLLSNPVFACSTAAYIRDTTNEVTDERILRPGDRLVHKANNPSYPHYVNYSVGPADSVPNYSFWVSGGSSGITITGDTFVVELFNQIS